MQRRLPFATNDNDTLTQNTDSEFKMKRNDLSFIHPADARPTTQRRRRQRHTTISE